MNPFLFPPNMNRRAFLTASASGLAGPHRGLSGHAATARGITELEATDLLGRPSSLREEG